MYSREQLNQSMQKVQENRKTYTEDSIDEARTKWNEATALVQHIESGGRSIYRLDEARRAEEDAHKELEDALTHSAPLAARKRAREFAEKREQERHTEQVQHSAEEKSAYLADLKVRWLATGGSAHSFEEQKEGMWVEEVKRRTQGPDLKEATKQKLAKSGRYNF